MSRGVIESDVDGCDVIRKVQHTAEGIYYKDGTKGEKSGGAMNYYNSNTRSTDEHT